MEKTFDNLYKESKENKSFRNLMKIISSEDNIKLAFRSIKTNTGSNTCGTDGLTISDIKDTEIGKYIETIKNKLNYYEPDSVKRVYIEKENGDKRPLGIPTITDRLIQQCIKQVLEPICEAKFYKHSYGFRPNRSTSHAIARLNFLVNLCDMKYVVDIDIKGFFDNVNHNKLIKQIWSIGIKDKKLISIIKAMLKSPIKGEGVPIKGTPQGGILSPLLANIVLNELDWWVASQWENMITRFPYKNNGGKYKALKKSNLKKVFLIRYADDFKIVCKNYEDAKKMYYAVKDFLEKRLKLEINEKKSKVVNLRKSSSEFLGLRFKIKPKGTAKAGYVLQSNIREKKKKIIEKELKESIYKLSKEANGKNVMLLNAKILGLHEYFKMATNVSIDFEKITYSVNRYMYNRLKNVSKYELPRKKSELYKRKYGGSKAKTWIVEGIAIFPIHYIQHCSAMNFSQDICKYTEEGRNKILKKNNKETNKLAIELAQKPIIDKSTQYNDNRISRTSMVNGICEVTGIPLNKESLNCHHKIPRELDGTDEYENLRIIHKNVHKLIHSTDKNTINEYLYIIKNKKALNKLNELRSYCKNEIIEIDF